MFMTKTKTLLPILSAAVLAVCCAGPKDIELGPYTVSVIQDHVYHIQDYNSANPAGEAFDAEGNKTHFNNCSDIYLVVGEKEALVIDLSNPINWADNAETLQRVLDERKMALEVLSGKRKGQVNEGNPQLNRFVYDYGVYIRYKDPDALK